MAKNVRFSGGFRGILASLAVRALPTILRGLTTGLLSSRINEAIIGSGDGLYLRKHDKFYRVPKCKGHDLYLVPHPRFGDGLFLKRGNGIIDGASMLMGKNIPFKNNPVSGWIL